MPCARRRVKPWPGRRPNRIEQPKPKNAAGNLEVCDRSGVFAPAARRLLERSDVAVMWLEHLLLLSMLQDESGAWTWGRYVVVHPAGNTDVADARYRDILTDDATYAAAGGRACRGCRSRRCGRCASRGRRGAVARAAVSDSPGGAILGSAMSTCAARQRCRVSAAPTRRNDAHFLYSARPDRSGCA